MKCAAAEAAERASDIQMLAPALRYVASVESDRIKAVSSLPGGQSGVPSSRFYVNLLRGGLTNETFPLRTEVVD